MAHRINPAFQGRNWSVLRLALGFTQMALAAFTIALLAFGGINRLSISLSVFTCALTSLSVLLFGSRR